MKKLIVALSIVILSTSSGCAQETNSNVSAEVIRVTLLGTGSPEPSPNRFGPSTLVEVGGEKLLFDVGRGATIRLAQAKVPLKNITVFLTHLHSDHINGLGDLWASGYMAPVFREKPLKIFGPTGIVQLTDGLKLAFQPDVEIRSAEMAAWKQPFHVSGANFDPTEVKGDGVIFDGGGVKVTAIRVKHAEKKAFGYRVDYNGKSVVISGDTSFSENLMKKSKGADLIVHEVMGVGEKLMKDPLIKGLLEIHTTPEQAGVLFSKVQPKLAVYTHILLGGVSEKDLVTETRKTYSGPLKVGQDLMTFVVDDDVTMIKK